MRIKSKIGMRLVLGSTLLLPFSGCAMTNLTRATLSVRNEQGMPVEGATIDAWLMRNASEGVTDEHGEYAFHNISIYLLDGGKKEFSAWARKSGYYDSFSGYTWFGGTVVGRAEPWNPVIEIPMKRIINQQPMLTSWIPILPAVDQDVGYDFLAGDWTPPYGVGVVTDIVLRATMQHGAPIGYRRTYRYDLAILFPRVGDGLLMYEDYGVERQRKGSVFRGYLRAPAGPYTNSAHWWVSYGIPGDGSESAGGNDVGNLSDGDAGKNNMVFRIRTTTNDAGTVIALYGKMEDMSLSGDEVTGRLRLNGQYYVNETPSDNLEQMPAPIDNIHLRPLQGKGFYSEAEAQRRGLNTLGRYTGKSLR